jgi:hypothetical protein
MLDESDTGEKDNLSANLDVFGSTTTLLKKLGRYDKNLADPDWNDDFATDVVLDTLFLEV